MFTAQIIGNLGADAQLNTVNGSQFVSFRVANTERFTDRSTGEVRETTEWISCTWNGDGGKVLQYLKAGTKVYVTGRCESRLYVSSKDGKQHAGINCSVRQLELCGGGKAQGEVSKELVLQFINNAPKEMRNELLNALNAPF